MRKGWLRRQDRNVSTDLLGTGEELLARASAEGVTLRLIGGIAVLARSGDPDLPRRLDREPPGDLDFAGLDQESTELERLFAAAGWEIDPVVAQGREYGIGRLIFHRGEVKVDVFLDELRMCHLIPLRDRLGADPATVPLAELLLSKLQVVELTRKDVADALMVLARHPVGASDGDSVNAGVIVELLRGDWGFEHTVRTNLDALLASRELTLLDAGDAETARAGVAELLARLDAAPRTLGWKLRARVGTRTRWYEEVGDVDR